MTTSHSVEDSLKLSLVEQYLVDVLTALGQMDHISSKYTHEGKCEDCKEPYKVTQMVTHNGIMSMPVEKRRQLLSRGWDLLAYNELHGKHELVGVQDESKV
jgi:hypothetical protein